MKDVRFRTLFVAAAVCALMVIGCGTVQEGTEGEDSWGTTPSISEAAMLEYRIDSLMQENRKLSQQLENASAENRNLAARTTELEGRTGTGTPTSGGGGTTTLTPSTVVNPGYESALSKFRNRRYQDATDEFSSLLSAGISDDLADNCRYWIGESYFAMKQFNEAVQQFEGVATMAGSDKADDAQLMLGNAYIAMGNKAAAKQALQYLIATYPSSPLVKRARAKLSGL
jgi:tol-pal system protein YbgF